jgi:hypothetical protein
MSGLDGDERSAASRTNFVVRDQFAFDSGASFSRLNYARD